ncbi:EAL domain-containing protein [Lutibaculum baratangense]|uniref:EAL domain protein n=1 Tax=Lutibaculum baratangense AMV1 TaxID=631454 RepID=V4RTL5_9HYPH|nr:EAL domain-containing protein [Lutibaculum baratangense]ESR26420.1 EAL domain protein [Lutibaculum baratangense AMV1]
MSKSVSCQACRDGAELPFAFSMAFQPIVDIERGRPWAYEALVRGPEGQSAMSILDQVTAETRYRFDQAARVKAIELAGRLFGTDEAKLSINFMPNAVYEPAACIRASLVAAAKVGFARDRLVFEFTENERVDAAHVNRIIEEYRRQGFLTAIDDFGSGYSGLNLLAQYQPDIIKLDMELIRGIAESRARRAIVSGVLATAEALELTVIAEGIETHEELSTLREAGITLFQGYYLARPAFEALPELTLPVVTPLPTAGVARQRLLAVTR